MNDFMTLVLGLLLFAIYVMLPALVQGTITLISLAAGRVATSHAYRMPLYRIVAIICASMTALFVGNSDGINASDPFRERYGLGPAIAILVQPITLATLLASIIFVVLPAFKNEWLRAFMGVSWALVALTIKRWAVGT